MVWFCLQAYEGWAKKGGVWNWTLRLLKIRKLEHWTVFNFNFL